MQSSTQARRRRFGVCGLWAAVFCLTAFTLSAAAATITVRVIDGNDDAEESLADGSIDLGSSDLELVTDGGDVQSVGIRFVVGIPQGSTIQSASIQFTVDEVDSGPTSVIISGELSPDAASFGGAQFDITSRNLTDSFVEWNDIPPWLTENDAGSDQQTPDLTAIVQEIVNQADWAANNGMVFLIDGSGERTAESFNGGSSEAPLLTVMFEPSSSFAPGTVLAASVDSSQAASMSVADACNAGQDVTYTITSSDPGVAVGDPATVTFAAGGSFTESFNVAINGVGTATLTATPAAGSPAACVDIPAMTVTVAGLDSIDLQFITEVQLGEQQQVVVIGDFLAAGTRDLAAAATTTYQVENIDDPTGLGVAEIGPGGVITALNPGTARITATNNNHSDSELLNVRVFDQTQTITSRVSSPGDDVEQKVEGGLMDFGSSDLEITDEGLPQVIGMRFLDVRIPPGATILEAALQFHVDETDSGDTSVRIFAVLSPDASAFTSEPFNLTSRPRAAFTADWEMIPPWNNVHEEGPDQRTPDLSALVQEIVNLPDWDSGNAMIFGILGIPGGRRTAESHNGESESAPLLEVTYSTEPGIKPDPAFAAVVDDSLVVALTLSQNCNAGQEVTYTIESSDPAVAAPAEASATFPVRGRFFDKVDLAVNGVGTATITARPADGSPAECGEIIASVEVIDVQSVDLQLQTTGMELGDAQQAQLVADYGPAGTRFRTGSADGSTYVSSDPTVATVDANGFVTAVGVGTAEITGTNKGFSSTKAVLVGERLTRIAFLVGDTRLNAGDQAVVDHLSSLRFSGSPAQIDPAGLPPNIVPINDDDIDERAIEARFDLLIGSSTTGGRQVGGQFRCNNTPFIFWAEGLHTINREGLSDAGGTSAGHTDQVGNPLEEHTELFILDNSHPITAGLTQDDFVTVYNEPQLITYAASGQAAANIGTLSADATSLAEYDFLDESTITFAEAGGLRFGDNSRFLARRVGLWFTDESFGHLNETGLTIFNNAVNWALASERLVLIPEGVNLSAARKVICPPELADGGTNQVQLLLIGSAEFSCPVFLSDSEAGTTYISSDEAVATVDDDGLVTSVALGTTTITVANGDLVNTIDIEVGVEAGAPGFTTEIWAEIGFSDDILALAQEYIAENDPTGTEVGIQVINFVDSGNPGEIANDLPFPILPPPALGGSNEFIARMTGFILFPDQ